MMPGQLETSFKSAHNNEATLRAVLAASPLAISWSDSEGRIEFWNRKALSMFGYSFEEISTVDLWMLRAYPDPLYRAEVKERWSAAVAEGKQRATEFNGGEYNVTCKDGTVRNVEIIGNHFDDRLMVILTDVTERRRIERELAQYRIHLEDLVVERTSELDRSREHAEMLLAEASRLREHAEHVAAALKQNEAELIRAKDSAEAANRAKSTFLSSMSHELRTPLNSILGFAQILRTDARLPQGNRESVNIIVRAGEHLLNLINDILEISRIESGKGNLASQDFVPTQWVRETLALLEDKIRQKDVQLLFIQASALPGMIRSDRDKLRRILANLVDNAIKFTNKGRISVQMSSRPQSGDESRCLLLLDIEDTGIGISPTDLERLFKPFEQLGPEAVNAGTGLGLTIVRHYVDMMQGTITVSSNPGAGSCFHVEIPVQVIQGTAVDAQTPPARQILGIAPGQPECRVLIVEDEQSNRLLAKALIERAGFKVMDVETGEEGVKAFAEWHPHFIWMDWRLPGISGIQATRRIRAMEGGKAVAIVGLTAATFQDQRKELLKSGMNDVIEKPYQTNDILECIARLTGIHYAYAEPAIPPSPALSPAALESLPGDLRIELEAALNNLDVARINTVVQLITLRDPVLGQLLAKESSQFAYGTILQALQSVKT